MPGYPGPFRQAGGKEQPKVKARTIRCLKIVNPVESTTTQDAAEPSPATDLEELRPAVDGDLVKKTALLREPSESMSGQERDLVRSVVPSNGCHRPKRLDKIS